jgi:hypothetical protein
MASCFVTGKVGQTPATIQVMVTGKLITLTRDQVGAYLAAPNARRAMGPAFDLAKQAPFTLGRVARKFAIRVPQGAPSAVIDGWRHEDNMRKVYESN